MSKRKPEVQPPEWQAPEKPAELSLEIATITPLFGGGYAARECDELIPVRSAAVRGHLRFWWRATAGAHLPPCKNSTKPNARYGAVPQIRISLVSAR